MSVPVENQLLSKLDTSAGQQAIEILLRLSDILYLTDPEKAAYYAQRAIAQSDGAHIRDLQILSRLQAVNCFFNLGDYGQCNKLLGASKKLLTQFPNAELELTFKSLEGKQLYMGGQIREAIEILLETDEKLSAYQLGEVPLHLQVICTCKLYLGLCWLKLKSSIKSLDCFQLGYEIAQKLDIEAHAVNFQAVFANAIGRVHMGSKEFKDSRSGLR